MYIPVWGEEMMTGNAEIDADHRELFEKIDALMVAISHSREAEIIQDTLNYFILYTKNHFIEEETLHRTCGAPRYNEHVAAHRRVSEDLDEILALYREEGLTPHMEFRLVNHVVRDFIDQLHAFDLPLARFLRGEIH